MRHTHKPARSEHVVIVGAGYAGVSAARRLRRGGAGNVTVVNPRAEFVERIRLHQLVAGNRAASLPLASLLPEGARLVQDHAESIDADRQVVALRGGGEVEFDYLVYAVGSRHRPDDVAGAAEHAVTMGDLDGALEARRRMEQLPAGASVTVVGGGLTGVELASELAEMGRFAVRLVTSGPVAASFGERGRAHVRRVLGALGAEVIEDASVTQVEAHKIVLGDGRRLGSDLTFVATRLQVPSLARDSGLEVGADGTLLVGRDLVSVSSPRIVGAGDAVQIGGYWLRPSCQAAVPVGAHAAESVLALMREGRPKPVRQKRVGQLISLGRRNALWQTTTLADRATPVVVAGRPAAWLKEQVCTATIEWALNPRRGWAAYSWSL